MEKILIATKNKDKFQVVKKILDTINNEKYSYYSLYDVNNIEKSDKEQGTIEERAYNKAKDIFSSIEKNDFKYIIGIDDGIEMKGRLIENIRDYIEDIINNKYLSEGEEVNIVRAYCFMEQDGKYHSVITKIPFKYKRISKPIDIKENSYPLSNVLTPLTSTKTIVEIDKDENNQYYLEYSKKKIEEVFE